MFPFGVLADDLTGACDTGAQFSARGARVLVLAGPQVPPPAAGDWDVVVQDTESRHEPPAEAAARVQAAARGLARAGWPVRYKKIDSTLRGPLVAELQPLLAAGAGLLVAPAFPPAGRTVERGIVRVGGTPVHETEIGRDRHNPVTESHLPSLLAALPGAVGQLTLHDQVRGAAHVVARLAALLAAGPCAVSADAVDEAHLDALAAALAARWAEDGAGALVGVGSAGLARALAAQALPLPRAAPLPPGWAPPPGGALPLGGATAARPRAGPVLVVAGSRTAVTAGQVAHLLAQPDVTGLRLDLLALDAADWERRAPGWVDAALRSLTAAADAGARTLVVQPVPDAGAGGAAGGAAESAESPAHFARRSGRLNAALGALVLRMVAECPPAGLVLTGGDIARAVLAALGAETVQLGPEVLPGLPLGWPVGGLCAGLPLVTKAGGFGGPEALAVAARALQAGAGRSA